MVTANLRNIRQVTGRSNSFRMKRIVLKYNFNINDDMIDNMNQTNSTWEPNYSEAAQYWVKKDRSSRKMPQDILRSKVEDIINSHKTCALATGFEDQIRCTPIEYNYHKGCFYLFSEGGIKFKGLERNKNVCLAVYDEYSGFGKLCGLQVSGQAEIIEPFSPEYLELLNIKNIPEEAMKKADHPLYLIKIVPEEAEVLSSAFKEDGYDIRQKI